MSETNEYRAYFTIVGDFHPSEITEQLGMQPTESWAKGDLEQRTGIARSFSRWSLESRLSTTEYIDRHVLDVLEQLKPMSESVLKLRSNYEGWIQLVAYFLNGQASVDLNSDIIYTMSKLRLGLNFDPYDLIGTEEGS